MKKNNHLGLLFKEMGAFKITLFISVIIAAIGSYVSLKAYTYIYLSVEEVIDHINNLSAIDAEALKGYGFNIILCVTGAYGLYGLSLLFSHITAFNTAAILKKKLIRHIGTLKLGFFDSNPSGALRKLIEKNTDSTEKLIAHQIPNTTQSFALPIFFVIYMFKYNVWMAIACLVPVIIGFILMMVMMMGKGGEFVRIYQKSSADMSAAVVEYVRGIPVMKTFGQSADSFKRYSGAVKKFQDYVYKFAMSMINADSAYNTSINSIFVTLIPTTLLLFQRTSDTRSIILEFIFFASVIPVAVTILKRIMSNSSETIIVEEAMEAIQKLLDEKPQEYSGNEVPISYDIELKDISFRYGENLPYVIKDVTLDISSKSTTAFVGMSGSGKSTIANLIVRFWDVGKGEIRIGGCDVTKISKSVLDEMMSVVFQESTLLNTTVAKNVSLYRPEATEEEILHALHIAQCDDILQRLPDGIHTVYGSKGTYFSGGEIQRIAIARAILKDAPIVILDEATAFADSENEYLIRKALNKLLENKMVIMIAHRMQTVRDADMICVVSNGTIIEQGNHSQLINADGAYKAMVDEYDRAVSWKIGEKENAHA